MAALLFKLRGVPDDEAQDIRLLLSENNIDYYETSAGNWGISLPAIWVRDTKALHKGRELIRIYQAERMIRVKQAYEEDLKTGRNRTIIDSIREQPVRFIIFVAVILAVLYLSTMPFLNFGN